MIHPRERGYFATSRVSGTAATPRNQHFMHPDAALVYSQHANARPCIARAHSNMTIDRVKPGTKLQIDSHPVPKRKSQYPPNMSESLAQIKSMALIIRESNDAGHSALVRERPSLDCCWAEIIGSWRANPDIRYSARNWVMQSATQKPYSANRLGHW